MSSELASFDKGNQAFGGHFHCILLLFSSSGIGLSDIDSLTLLLLSTWNLGSPRRMEGKRKVSRFIHRLAGEAQRTVSAIPRR